MVDDPVRRIARRRNFPDRQWIKVDDLTMAVHIDGPDDGLPVVLCHGWPELAFSWRQQICALAEAGFKAIAPDMRGFGHTGGPKGRDSVSLYDMEHLTGDLVGLMDALSIERAVFVGHDWGGLVVWQMPLLHPDRVAGVIGVNTPFIPRTRLDPVESLRALYGDSMYMVRFQEFGIAEAILGADTARSLRFLLRRASHSQSSWSARPREKRNLAILDALAKPEEEWGGRVLLSAKELEVYRVGYERSGWEGGINWYRNLSRNWKRSEEILQRVDVPSLFVGGENDVVFPPALIEGMRGHVEDLEVHVLSSCGHWTQTEKPDELNGLMVSWLCRRFG